MANPPHRILHQDGWKVWHVPDFDPRALLARFENEDHPRIAGFEDVSGYSGYWKAGPLRTKTAWRYGIKQRLLAQAHPRLAEFRNLVWLRERLFAAPRPLAVGEWRRAGLVRHQWLFTEQMPGRKPLSEEWSELEEPDRKGCILHLADEVARMHSLHFVHHDLFPHNIMVGGMDDPQPIAFLNAWAGGPGFCLRGPSYDIACLALRWPGEWEREEQALFLQRYLESLNAQGRPIRNLAHWVRSIERQRATWVHKLQASPRRRGGRPVPCAEWRAPI
ncbi:MAG: hypothetical protein GY930_14805 [bacterium]|nr:hypothetical protein [bacterium]